MTRTDLLNAYRSVVITVTAAGMVQVSIYQVVDVVAVGHSIVSAAFVMFVTGIVTGAFVVRSALSSIFAPY